MYCKRLSGALLVLFIFMPLAVSAQSTFKAVSSGPWENLGTWQKYNAGTNSWNPATTLPGPADIVSFASGITVTLSSDINIGSGYNLGSTLTINAANTITVIGNATFSGAVSGGTISVLSGQTLTLSKTSLSTTVLNAGTLNVLDTNNFTGVYNSTGALTLNNASAVFRFNSGSDIPAIGTINCILGALYFKDGAVPHGLPNTLSIDGKIDFSSGSAIRLQNLAIGYYGTLDGSDSVIISQTLSHQGYLSGPGKRIVTAACTATLFNSAWVSDTLDNYGVLEWKDNQLKNYGKIVNHNIMLISAATNGNCSVTLENYGTITRSGATNYAIAFNYPVLNYGTIQLNAGTNSFYGNTPGLPLTGIINAAANTTVQIAGTNINGTLNASHVVNFSGADTVSGTYNNPGTTQTLSGAALVFKNTASIIHVGTIECSAGAIYFKPGAIIQNLSGTVNCGGFVDFSTGKKIALSVVTIYSQGTLHGTDSITVSNTFTHTGYLSGSGKKILLASSLGTLSGNAWVSDSLYNYGTLSWTDAGIHNGGCIFNYGVFNLPPGNNTTSNVTIENFGTMQRTAGKNSSITFAKPVKNQTAVSFFGGIINFNGNTAAIPLTGTIHASDSTTLNISSAHCNGTINAAYIVAFSGNANVNGTYNNSGTTTNTSGNTLFNASSTITNLGTVNCASGGMYFKPGAFIQSMSGVVNCTGLVDFSTGRAVPLNTVTIASQGTLQGADSLLVAAVFTHTGYLSGSGKKILLPSCAGTLSGNAWIGDTLYNYGTLSWTGNSIHNGGRIINYNLFTITSNDASTSAVTIENRGTILRSTTNNAGLTLSNPLFNYGAFTINGGTVFIGSNSVNQSSGSITVGSGAALQLTAACTFDGSITIGSGGTLTGSQYALTINGPQLINNGSITTSLVQFNGTTSLSGSGSIATPSTVASSGSVTLASDHQLKSLTISSGGIFNAAGYKLSLNGAGAPLLNNGTLTIPPGILEYNGSAAQSLTASGLSNGNVSFNNAAGVTLSSPWAFGGSIYLTNGQFNNGANLTLNNGAFIIRTNGTMQTIPSVSGRIGVYYTANTPITTGNELPANTTSLGFLSVADTAGVTLSRSITVNDSVVFTGGKLNTANYQLTLGPAANLVNETDSGYVVGTVYSQRVLGTAASDMGNIGCAIFAGADSLGVTSVLRKSGPGTAVTQNGNCTINRQWIIASEFMPSSGRNVKFSWPVADDNSLYFTPYDNAEIWRNGNSGYESLWNTSSVFGMNPREITISGLTEFGTFTTALASHPLRNMKVQITALFQGLFDGVQMIPDTVTIFFANPSPPYAFADSIRVLPNSLGAMTVPARFIVNGQSYYIVMKQRNSIETWSSAPVKVVNYDLAHNFTTSASQAYGANLGQIAGKFCIYSGDVNQDGIVDFSDLSAVDNAQYNFVSGYVPTDLTGDDFVDFSDLSICDNNQYNFISAVTPLTALSPAGGFVKRRSRGE